MASIGRAATVLNAGDSRGLPVTAGGAAQVTTNTLVQRLVEVGQITPEEARHHSQKPVIYRVIGDSAELAVDLSTPGGRKPGRSPAPCASGRTQRYGDG